MYVYSLTHTQLKYICQWPVKFHKAQMFSQCCALSTWYQCSFWNVFCGVVCFDVSVVYCSHLRVSVRNVLCAVVTCPVFVQHLWLATSWAEEGRREILLWGLWYSKHLTLYLADPPLSLKTIALPTYSHLRVWIRQTVEHELCPCLFLLLQSFLSQTIEHVGNEGWIWCHEGVSPLASSHQHPLRQNTPKGVRMWEYFWLRFYLHGSLLW